MALIVLLFVFDCADAASSQELSQGTLGGVFTTVEGLLTKIHKSLLENNPFSVGDSTTLHHSADPSVYDVRMTARQ